MKSYTQTSKLSLWGILLCLSFSIFCTQEEKVSPREYPRIKTLAVSELDSTGITGTAEIIYRGDFEIIDHGFVWSEREDVDINTGNTRSLGRLESGSSFSARISDGLFPNTRLYLKAFVATAERTIYGNPILFSSAEFPNIPIITEFNPKTALVDDPITIRTRGLPPSSDQLKVFFGDKEATIIGFYEERLEVLVPENLPADPVTLKLKYRNWKAFETEETFIHRTPIVTGISPATGNFKDVIEIDGQYFHSNMSRNQVLFDTEEASIIDGSGTRLRVVVPDYLPNGESQVSVKIQAQVGTASDKFVLTNPQIYSLSEIDGFIDDEIWISGEYFYADIFKNEVRLGGNLLEVINGYADTKRIQVRIADGIYLNRRNPVEVTVAGRTVASQIQFKLLDPWLKKAQLTSANGANNWNSPIAETLNGMAYIGLGGSIDNPTIQNKDFFKFDPQSGSLTRLKDFPGTASRAKASFVIGDKIYVGMGTEGGSGTDISDFYVYETSSDQWSAIAPYPGLRGRMASVGFAIDGKGYVLTGLSGSPNFYEYDPATNSWTSKAEWPATNSGIPEVALVTQGKGYIITENGNSDNLWEYDPITDSWLQKTSSPTVLSNPEGKVGFIIQGELYITAGAQRGSLGILQKYNISQDSWSNVNGFNNPGLYQGGAFGLNGKGYLFGGNFVNTHNDFLYEFELNP